MLDAGSILAVISGLGLRKKLFLQLVFYIALCDLFSSLALIIGGTRSESIACYVQGIVNNYFSLASFFWTITIGYQVHLVLWHSRVQRDLTYFAIFNWVAPLVLSLIPISTATYANDDGTPGWCFLHDRPGYAPWVEALWYILSFYLWIYIAIFYLSYVILVATYKLYYLQRGMETDAHLVVERIIQYPIIVIICWVVSSVIDIGLLFGLNLPIGSDNPFSITFTYILPNLQGFFSGIAFFITNKDVLDELLGIAKAKGWIKGGPDDEEEEVIVTEDGEEIVISRPNSVRRQTNGMTDNENENDDHKRTSDIEMSRTSSFFVGSTRGSTIMDDANSAMNESDVEGGPSRQTSHDSPTGGGEGGSGNRNSTRSGRLSLYGRKSMTTPLESIVEGDGEHSDVHDTSINNPILTADTLRLTMSVSGENASFTSSPSQMTRPISMDSIASSLSTYEARNRQQVQQSPPRTSPGKTTPLPSSPNSPQRSKEITPSSSVGSAASSLQSLKDIKTSRNNSNWFERNIFRSSNSSATSTGIFRKKKKGTVYSSNSLLALDKR